MLSAKRIVAIFRQRGGGPEFLAQNLTPERLDHLKQIAQGEPLIVRTTPDNDSFVLTCSHLTLEDSRGTTRIPLEEICSVVVPRKDPREVNVFGRVKVEGGDIHIGLPNGPSLRINVQPGGAYFGLMNVLLRFATINRNRGSGLTMVDRASSPTTNDGRPTTQS
jgi:hypothetical protein